MADNNKEHEHRDVETTPQLEVPKNSFFWIKNCKGEPSASLTFVVIAFIVTTLAFAASMFVKIGPLELRQFDAAACGAYLGPLISLYAFRRYTDDKFSK